MQMSDMLTRLKMTLGIQTLSLPTIDIEKSLIEVIKYNSLRTFSQYFPHKTVVQFDIDDLKAVRTTYQKSTYEIPKMYTDMGIYCVTKVDPINHLYDGNYWGGSPMINATTDLYESSMLGAATYDLMSMITPPFTWRFDQPKYLTIFNMTTFLTKLEIELGIKHFDNLSSITPTMEEDFFELAVLDSKVYLYNTLKHYDNIETVLGTIQLHIDEWSGAEQDRLNKIQEWKQNYHLEQDCFIVI